MISDLMASLEKKGKILNGMGFSSTYVSSKISKTKESLKEEIDAHSAEIKGYHANLSQLEEDLPAITYKGFKDAFFMNLID